MADDKIDDLAEAIRPYLDLLEPLVDGAMSPGVFESAFFARYADDNLQLSDRVFEVFERPCILGNRAWEAVAEAPGLRLPICREVMRCAFIPLPVASYLPPK